MLTFNLMNFFSTLSNKSALTFSPSCPSFMDIRFLSERNTLHVMAVIKCKRKRTCSSAASARQREKITVSERTVPATFCTVTIRQRKQIFVLDKQWHFCPRRAYQ